MKKTIIIFFLTVQLLMCVLSGCAPTSPLASPTDTPISIPSTIVLPTRASNSMPVDHGMIMLEQDFESGNANGLTVEGGTWKIDSDEAGNHAYCNLLTAGYSVVAFGTDRWRDYAVELRVKTLEHHEDPYISVYARRTPEKNYYGALNFQTFYADLSLNEPYRSLGREYYPTTDNQWYLLRLEVAGDSIKFYIDNQLVGEGTDATIPEGMAGFGTSPNTHMCFDDVRVWNLSSEDQVAALTSTPTGSNTLSAGVEPSSILFDQNFDSGNYDGISFHQPYWQMKEDQENKFMCTIPGDYYAGLNFGSSAWTNYAVELRFQELDHKADSYSTAAIYFRYDPSTNLGNAGLLDLSSHIAHLLLNRPLEYASNSSYPTVKNTWYTMRVEVAGQNTKFFINNQQVGSGTDTTYRYGLANLSVSPHVELCVDDIRVWALDESGEIASVATPNPTLVATLENNAQDIYPQVWAQISPTGKSYEYKVNCGRNYSKLETCFLWNIDQVIVTSPAGDKYSLQKDFNINNYSGEVTRRWVLYGPDGTGLPENGQYLFTYYKNGEILNTQTVSYTSSELSIPTQVVVSQLGNDLHVTWQPPSGVTSEMSYKVIVFVRSNGQFATSLSFPPSSSEATLPAPPLTPGSRYFVKVALYWPTGYAYSVDAPFTWISP